MDAGDDDDRADDGQDGAPSSSPMTEAEREWPASVW